MTRRRRRIHQGRRPSALLADAIAVEFTRSDAVPENVPRPVWDPMVIANLGLTSCDFVGDSGCNDATCPQCHPAPDTERAAWRAVWSTP